MDSTNFQVEKLFSTIKLKQLLLDSVLEMTNAINANFSRTQLLKIYEFIVRSQLNIGSLVLFTEDSGWHCDLIYGVDQNFLSEEINIQKEILEKISKDVYVIEKNDSVLSQKMLKFDRIIPIYHKNKALAVAIVGNINQDDSEAKMDIITYIQTLTNIIIVAMENKNLARAQIKREGMKKELELAAQMQAMLFPSLLLQNKNIEMNATYLPHQDIGGDYYDYIFLNENEFIVCIADVSGKGMAAALLMSNFQASFHALLNYTTSLTELVLKLNSTVNENAKNEKFITFFICKFNLLRNELVYINAGHNPPVLFTEGQVHLLDEGTTGLGMFEALPFINEQTIQISKGSLLCLYTDGIVEQVNDSGTEFGIERLSDYIKKNAGNNEKLVGLHDKLITYITAFKQSQSFSDDITLFSCRMRV
jgi:sigma-B regulation protein RsbU (phosphoserine phosphatase)